MVGMNVVIAMGASIALTHLAAVLMTAGGTATPAGACGIVGGMNGWPFASTWPEIASEHTACQSQSKVVHFVKYRYIYIYIYYIHTYTKESPAMGHILLT